MLVRVAAAGDAVCILAFAAAGRHSHAEGMTLLGVLGTAGPFLVGCAAGWLATRGWRQPESLRTGAIIWAATVVVGMAVRLLTGSNAPWPFVIVASVTLAVLLLGWRGAVHGVRRTRTRAAARTSA